MSAVIATDLPLVASPYELRVSLGAHLSETEVYAALESGECGFVHSFTTGSTVDGPGVRIVMWLTGCEFRCLYCHNPDTWKLKNGMRITLSRAIDAIRGYRFMRGGLTISGGEPLVQDRFVLRVLAEAKELGIHTALDTNGHLGDRLRDHELTLADLVLLDLKGCSPNLHRRLTGADNQAVLDFARRLARLRRSVWIRFVLIPGWTDDSAEIHKAAHFVAGLGNVERVEVLPFHQLGSFKWKKLGMTYEFRELRPPDQANVEETAAIFRSAGLNAH